MDNDYGVDESGSSLRQKLEETLEENRRITTELSGLKASSLIEEHGYGLVKLEDLDGVALDEMADTALKLQEERQVQQVDLARDMLARRGLDGADLDKAVEDFREVIQLEPEQLDALRGRAQALFLVELGPGHHSNLCIRSRGGLSRLPRSRRPGLRKRWWFRYTRHH